MKNRLHIFIILLVCLLSAGCDNYIDDFPMPEEFQMQDGEFEGLGEDLEFGRNANEMPRVKSPVAFMEATAWAAMLLRTSLYSAR